jgi:hypothetical protein
MAMVECGGGEWRRARLVRALEKSAVSNNDVGRFCFPQQHNNLFVELCLMLGLNTEN